MSTTKPTANDIVDWYFHPENATATPRPRKPYNHPVKSLEESIRLTLRYLTAASVPVDQGRIRPIRGRYSQQTLFWSVYEVREDIKIDTLSGPKTRTVIRYFGFDASANLTLETVVSQSYESHYENGFSWPDPDTIKPELLEKLLEKLEKFRETLITR